MAVTRGGFFGRRLMAARDYPQPEGDSRWASALAGLSAALAESPGKSLRVVLSNRLMQFRLLPWRDDLPGDAEYRALAQLEFSSVFGTLADDWTVVLSDEPPDRTKIAAAIPGESLRAIQAAASAHNSRVVSVQPALKVAMESFPDNPTSQPYCMVIAEQDSLCFSVRDMTGWLWLRQQRVDSDWASGMQRLLEEESRLSKLELSTASTCILAPAARQQEIAALNSQGFILGSPSPALRFPGEIAPKFIYAWCA